MQFSNTSPLSSAHSHVFLGAGHKSNERKTWAVIWLCAVMMFAEILGGSLFGSLALVADGLHMSTHAGALLIAAMAYTYSRRHAHDSRFVFGTGKLGDLAGFTSAVILAMIALLIGYEAVVRLFSPVTISFKEAIPIAAVGLLVNLASAWLLRGDEHHGHSRGHGHTHGNSRDVHGEALRAIDSAQGRIGVELFEDNVPPRFRLRFQGQTPVGALCAVTIETERPDGQRQLFTFVDRGAYLESLDEIPEPHEFKARVRIDGTEHELVFTEHGDQSHHDEEIPIHHAAHRDNNMRAAYVHVMADAAVSVLAITGLGLASYFGWVWMDPVAGILGALVIANWSYGLSRDAGSVLLDMNSDVPIADRVRKAIEVDGDQLVDLHLWRLGPGHLGAILSVITDGERGPAFYRAKLGKFKSLSHVTIEV